MTAEVVVRHVVRRALDARAVATVEAIGVLAGGEREERQLVGERAVGAVFQVPVHTAGEAVALPVLPAGERAGRDAAHAVLLARAAERLARRALRAGAAEGGEQRLGVRVVNLQLRRELQRENTSIQEQTDTPH